MNFIAEEEEVEQHGLLVKGKKPKKIILRKALGISSSAVRNSDVNEIFHFILSFSPKQ